MSRMLAKVDEFFAGNSMGFQLFQNGVRANLAVPVFAVPEITFGTMHDRVPVRTFWGLDDLADLVRFMKKTMK